MCLKLERIIFNYYLKYVIIRDKLLRSKYGYEEQ